MILLGKYTRCGVALRAADTAALASFAALSAICAPTRLQLRGSSCALQLHYLLVVIPKKNLKYF
jgi:hypothetical protein